MTPASIFRKIHTARRLSPYERERVARLSLNRLAPRWFSSPRDAVGKRYLMGCGLEIGALHNPLRLGKRCRVRCVDRMSVADLRAHYPELSGLDLVPVDVIDDGETLGSIADESQDFVIANHFLEHSQNPLSTLENLFRVLKSGGILFLAVPDKRFTFDIARPITPFSHILRDYQEGPQNSRAQHYDEWVEWVEHNCDATARENRARQLERQGYSIHFHVWDQSELLRLLLQLRETIGVECYLEQLQLNDLENIAVLRKL